MSLITSSCKMLNKGTFMKLELDGSIEHNLQSPKSANYFML